MTDEIPDEAPTLRDIGAEPPRSSRELTELVLCHGGGIDAEAFAAVARAVAAELDPKVVVRHAVGDALLAIELPSAAVVIPIYPHSSTRSRACSRGKATTIVWFAYADSYLEAVAASVRAIWEPPARLVFVAEDIADVGTHPIYARNVRTSADAIAKRLGCEHDTVFFGGDHFGEQPDAKVWLESHARDRRLVLVPLTQVCEGDETAAIDRELVPLARSHGALDVRRAPAIGVRIAPTLASLARRAISDDD